MSKALFSQLTAFHAIAAEGSITGAAGRLGLSVPAVSKMLKALEDNIGVPLFNRTTRRQEITEAGKILLARSSDAMQSLRFAIESVQDLGQAASGTVRITVARFAYLCILKPLLGQFRQTYPQIQLEISVYDGTIDIVEQGFDMGIRFGGKIEEGMVTRRLIRPFRNGLFVSDKYACKHGIPESYEDLSRHQLIGYRFMTAKRMVPLTLNNRGEEITVDMPTCFVANDIDVVADAIRQGVGIGRVFEPIMHQFPDRDTFIPVLEPFWQTFPAVYLYFPQNSQKAKRIRATIDFLTENCASK